MGMGGNGNANCIPAHTLECRCNYGVKLKLVGRWWVGCCIWYSEEGTGRDRSCTTPLALTTSVPVTIQVYNGPLLCSFNVPVKGLRTRTHNTAASCTEKRSLFTCTNKWSLLWYLTRSPAPGSDVGGGTDADATALGGLPADSSNICEPLSSSSVCKGLNDSETLCQPARWAGEAIQEAINATRAAMRSLEKALRRVYPTSLP